MPMVAIQRREAEDAPAAPMPHRQTRFLRLVPPVPAKQPALLDWARAVAAAADRRIAELETRLAYLEGQVVTDELTGLFNRRGFTIALSRATAAARRGGAKGVVILCDLDGFKQVNDLLGHAHGNELLKQLGALIRRRVRRMDAAARIGGDEFALLLIGASVATARRKCLCIARAMSLIGLNASFGVASFEDGEDEEAILHRADMAMYEDKRRNADLRASSRA
jgi:diguanylate cyclase (GGDEF)-like protein